MLLWLFQSSLVSAQKQWWLWCPVGEHRATQQVSKTQNFLSEMYDHKGCISGICCLLACSNNDDVKNLPGLQDSSPHSVTRTTEASSISQWPPFPLFGFYSWAAGSSSVLICSPFSSDGQCYPESCKWLSLGQLGYLIFSFCRWLILFEISPCF